MAGLVYLIGLVICSIAVGQHDGAYYGWMVLGGGMMLLAIIDIINLKVRK